MSKKRHCEPTREISVRRTGGYLNKDINNISKHIGITKNRLLVKAIPAIVASYPEYMRTDSPPCQPCERVEVRGLGKQTIKELENIANYIGVDVGNLIKIEEAKLSISYEPHMRLDMTG